MKLDPAPVFNTQLVNVSNLVKNKFFDLFTIYLKCQFTQLLLNAP